MDTLLKFAVDRLTMEPIYVVLLLCVAFSELGTYGRMLAQWKRDGVFPGGKEWEFSVARETGISVVAGVLLWLLDVAISVPEDWLQPVLYVGCMALGYAGVDALEALLNKYVPTE
uniref:Uncharacterized protein n=1 Tax=viral metagenome TaxID=1070528 RepID=A0A6M3M776_9ZZZZ